VANHKSARKRARQSEKRRVRNRDVRTRVKGAVKRANQAVDSGDAGAALEAVRKAESVLRRASSKGAIPAKRASRTIARLSRSAHRINA
jgi:small subunit ribosomal protein S20